MSPTRLDESTNDTYFTSWLNTISEDGESAVTAVEDEDQLSETFAALANSTRRALLARLAEGGATVTELAEPFDMTLPAISKHLKVLEQAGLVRRSKRAQYRPCVLDAAPLEELSAWAEQYRPIWEARFNRMGDYLTELQSQEDEHDD